MFVLGFICMYKMLCKVSWLCSVLLLSLYISISDTRHLDYCNALLSRWRVLINLVINVISTLKRIHSRVHHLQSRCTHLPSSEWQCSSVSVVLLHLSHWAEAEDQKQPVLEAGWYNMGCWSPYPPYNSPGLVLFCGGILLSSVGPI